MANKDVKQYYYAMLNQYLEMKADLADFEQALADGFITEDQLNQVKAEVLTVESNYERLSYIMYLLEMPNRASKKTKHARSARKLLDHFEAVKADQASIEAENKSALDNLRSELKRLKEVGN